MRLGFFAPLTTKPRPSNLLRNPRSSSLLKATRTGVLLVPNKRATGSSVTTMPAGNSWLSIAFFIVSSISAYRVTGR